MGQEIAKKEKAESGMMVVEAVLSFTVFIMVVIAIVYLINIFMVHNRVQFAINSAAHELASYSYVYTALGIGGLEDTLAEDGSPHTTPINDTANQLVDSLNKIESFVGSVSEAGDAVMNLEWDAPAFERVKADAIAAKDSVGASISGVKGLLSNPRSMLVGMIYIGVSRGFYEVKKWVGSFVAPLLAEKYLEQENMSADEYLRAYGIKDGYAGLDFSGTTIFAEDMGPDNSSGRIIDIVVSYDIDMKFIELILPNPTVHVVQRVSVAGWVDGDGEKLSDYGITKM